MDFNFTDEQSMVRDSLTRLVRETYDYETRNGVIASESGWRPEIWAQLAELGLLGMPFSEDDGGFGGGAVDSMIVMEEFGQGLVVEPYVPTVVCAGGFLKHAGTAAQKEEHIGGIVDGSQIFAFAYAEPRGRYDLADLETTAKKSGDGYVLNGQKAVVIGAPWATHLIVTARTSGGQRDRNGVSVFVVDKKADGVVTRDYPTVDGRRASEVYFENVSVPGDALIGEEDNGLPLIGDDTEVLLAEDDHDIAELMIMLMAERGIDVTWVENGALALAALAQEPHKFDIVLMDIHMPVMTGYEALAELQKANNLTPVVIMSASAVDADRHKAESLGCYKYLVKPVDVDDVVEIMTHAIEDKRHLETSNLNTDVR